MSRGGWVGNRERQAATWVRKHLGKRCFAPFTGQDWRAYNAWVHCLELYFGSDMQGEEWALEALRCCLCCAQPKCWPIFKASIPAIGDWSHEDQIWAKLDLVEPAHTAPRHPRLELKLVPKPPEKR